MESAFKEQLLLSQMEVQEATLSALSKELHDNIGQLLSTTKMLIGIAERSLPQAPDTLHTASQTLGKAISELRSLSKSMSTEWLEQFDLMENLQVEVHRINAADTIKVHFSQSDKIRMKADEQIILFRIIQEAIQNALKHAFATNIFIEIFYQEDKLHFAVKDDGRGFDETKITKGLGLINIIQRTKILGGNANWKSTEKGSTLHIDIPLKEPTI